MKGKRLYGLTVTILVMIVLLLCGCGADHEVFSFLYFGDTQAGEPGYDFTAFEQLAVVAAGLPDAPELAVFGGDMVDDGGDNEQWSQFLRAAAPLGDIVTAAVP